MQTLIQGEHTKQPTSPRSSHQTLITMELVPVGKRCGGLQTSNPDSPEAGAHLEPSRLESYPERQYEMRAATTIGERQVKEEGERPTERKKLRRRESKCEKCRARCKWPPKQNSSGGFRRCYSQGSELIMGVPTPSAFSYVKTHAMS